VTQPQQTHLFGRKPLKKYRILLECKGCECNCKLALMYKTERERHEVDLGDLPHVECIHPMKKFEIQWR
jgi:hypothetical protein